MHATFSVLYRGFKFKMNNNINEHLSGVALMAHYTIKTIKQINEYGKEKF